MYLVQTDKSETDLNHVTGTVLSSRDTELNPQGGYCLQGQEAEGCKPKAAEQDHTCCARQRSIKVATWASNCRWVGRGDGDDLGGGVRRG